MRIFPLLGLGLLSLVLNGCASSAYIVKSTPSADIPPVSGRILIAVIADKGRLDNFPVYYSSLDKKLRSDLSACGLQPDVMEIARPTLLELSLDDTSKTTEQKIQARLDSYQPGYFLRLNIGVQEGRSVSSGAQLSEMPSRRILWSANITNNYWDMTIGSTLHAEAFADSIIKQMNTDGVLHNCVPGQK